jgi:selenocysteine-specific elongation factor
MAHMIVGTAGHIDHGKTALVKALTGIDADRLKEEKERGITIDLGFANLAIDSATTIGFIDVPGHERFIKNMLAGIGGIDLVMLVIAADESIMPQTREHLEICSLLRIPYGLIVLTKIDAVDRELVDLVELEVHDFLKGSFLERSPVLRVSSHTGEGIPQLVETLRELSRHIDLRDPTQIFRLPVDRCFTMKGFGTVVSGTLVAGRVRRDDEVEILPQRSPARVRGIQVHGAAVDEARAGQRTALNLQRVEVSDITRGMVVTVPAVFRPSAVLDVNLELLRSAAQPIIRWKRIRFHVGTAELIGEVVLLDQHRLEPGQSAFAQLRLEQPTFALPGDRFIIRQYSPMVTIGGGEILDALPRKHPRSKAAAVVDRLKALRHGSADDRILMLIEESGLNTIDLPHLVARLGLAPANVRDHVSALAERSRIRVLSDNPFVAISAEVFASAMERAAVEVRRFHETEPLMKGIGREELKTRVFGDAPPIVFRAVIEKLIADRQLAATEDILYAFGRTVTLKEDEERIRNQLAERYRSLGLKVPASDELIESMQLDRKTARKIIQLMIKENVLVKISDDLIVERQALNKLIEDVRALKTARPKFGVREFKDLTGLSRKFAVPLLEYLDGQRVTRRVGDERVIL